MKKTCLALQQQGKEHFAMRNLGGKANLNNVIEGKNTKLKHSLNDPFLRYNKSHPLTSSEERLYISLKVIQ